jgi:acetate kinase
MVGALLVLNAGSSSLKFSVFADEDPPRLLLRGAFEELPTAPRFVARRDGAVIAQKTWPSGSQLGHDGAIDYLFDWGGDGVLSQHRLSAVGHRVVHGGTRFSRPVVVDVRILSELRSLIPLAPLHQPHNLAAIEAVADEAPWLDQVACFDTAFHRTQPAVAQAFALPRRYLDEGLRRYGFHGLSYEYIAATLPRLDARGAGGRTVVAHLGNGASMCALYQGHSVATTMSFTALDGLMMGTRCGEIDPGVLLYLIDRHHMSGPDLQRLLYEESGLLGVSGRSSDMRELLASAEPAARDAIDLFVYRASRELGSLAAALGGLDALVFTGGIGENAAAIRARICQEASWLGVKLVGEANAHGGPRITTDDSPVAAWVVPTNEELMIAMHTRAVLGASEVTDAHRDWV